MRSSVAATLLLSALSLVACNTMPALVAVPDAIKADAGQQVVQIVPAKGVQIYECRAKANTAPGQSGAFEWAFVAPEAELFNTAGTIRIGRHYGGPTWESIDGSKLVGSVKNRADAPQSGNIPWLLLFTTAAGPKGSFSDIAAIQRVNTVGGIAPIAACGAGNVGAGARVPYTADYYMLAKK